MSLREHLSRDIWTDDPYEIMRHMFDHLGEGHRPTLIQFGAGVATLFDYPRASRYLEPLPEGYLEELQSLYREVYPPTQESVR